MSTRKISAGAAKVNITPSADYFPVFNKPNFIGGGKESIFSGVHDDIYARVLIIDNGENRVVIFSFDWGMIESFYDHGEIFLKIISETANVPVSNIMITATHNHSCLDLNMAQEAVKGGEASFMRNAASPEIIDDFIKKAERYEAFVEKAVKEAVEKAVASMRPAKIGYGKGKSYVNVNRHCYSSEGKPSIAGFEPDRPSDRDLIVLRVDDLEGNPIGFVYNYACHASLMANNKPDGEHTEVTGDLSGVCSCKIEKAFDDKAVAIFTSGAGGDQNAVLISRVYKVLPNGKGEMFDLGPAAYVILEFMTDMLARDTMNVINSITEFKEETRIWAKKDRADLKPEHLQFDGGKFSEHAMGGETEFQFTLIMLGDIALAANNGEVYTSIGMRLKEDSPYRNTMYITHAGRCLAYIKDDSGNGPAELLIREKLYNLMEEYSDEEL